MVMPYRAMGMEVMRPGAYPATAAPRPTGWPWPAGGHPRPTGGRLVGRRHVGPDGPLACDVDVPAAQRPVDGEDLDPVPPADGPTLGHLVAGCGQYHLDVEGRSGRGERQVLGGGPDARSPAGQLQRLDARGQPAAPEQEVTWGRETPGDGQPPVQRVVGCFQAEKGAGVHGPGTLHPLMYTSALPRSHNCSVNGGRRSCHTPRS